MKETKRVVGARRNGAQLSRVERTDAVLRVLAGEDVASVSAWLRVRPAQVKQWAYDGTGYNTSPWRYRSGPWGATCSYTNSYLCPAEILAGCEIVDTPESARVSRYHKVMVQVGKPRTDPALVAMMYRERRDLFVELLSSMPPEMSSDVALDQHQRVWLMLHERDRDELTPAWDAFQLAADCLYDARRKIKAITGLLRAGETLTAPEVN